MNEMDKKNFSQLDMISDKQLIIISDDIILVPYLPRHVEKYHGTYKKRPVLSIDQKPW